MQTQSDIPSQDNVKTEVKEPRHENKVPESRFKEVYGGLKKEQRRTAEQEEMIRILLEERESLKPPKETGSPDPAKFPGGKFDPDYIEAVTEYKINAVLQHQQVLNQQRTEDENLAAQRREIDAKEKAFVKLNPDYYDSVESLSSILPANRGMRDAIMESDDPPGVAYYLSKNFEEAEKISRLSPMKAALAIGKIEDKVKEKPEPKPKSPPPSHIKPGGTVPPADLSEARSTEEYIRMYRAQRA
jgi:hypothetical protein